MSNDIYRQNRVNLKAGVLRKDCVFVFVDRVSGGRPPCYSLISSFNKITERAARQA